MNSRQKAVCTAHSNVLASLFSLRVYECFSFNVIVIGSAPSTSSSSILLHLFAFFVVVFVCVCVFFYFVFFSFSRFIRIFVLFHSFGSHYCRFTFHWCFCSSIICVLENHERERKKMHKVIEQWWRKQKAKLTCHAMHMYECTNITSKMAIHPTTWTISFCSCWPKHSVYPCCMCLAFPTKPFIMRNCNLDIIFVLDILCNMQYPGNCIVSMGLHNHQPIVPMAVLLFCGSVSSRICFRCYIHTHTLAH